MPTLAPEAAPARGADPELSAELEELLALVMAWMGGEAAARPRGLRAGTVVEALGEALVALWEDRLVATTGGAPRTNAAAGLAAVLPVGALVLDGALAVRSANRAFFALIERPRGSVLGQPLSEALGVGVDPLAAAADEAAQLGEASLPLTLHQSSGALPARLQLAPLPDGGWSAALWAETPAAPSPVPSSAPPPAAHAWACLRAAAAGGLSGAPLAALVHELERLAGRAPPLVGRTATLSAPKLPPLDAEALRWRLRALGLQLIPSGAELQLHARPRGAAPAPALQAAATPPPSAEPIPAAPSTIPDLTLEWQLSPLPRGPMSTPHTYASADELAAFLRVQAENDGALDALCASVSAADAGPVSLAGAPALDREATGYLAELEQTLGKTGLFDRLLGIFITDLVANEGVLQAALASGEREQLARIAHTIKGAAATIGARQIERVAQTLEYGAKGRLPAQVDDAALHAMGAQLLTVAAHFRAAHGGS
ncbi:MAG: Hpt domain-containing protein [Deltaproteobacteria bacterium]|nr:Hpt domain-containing protein [Deltaproteobacteria bacterium]